MSGSLNGKHLDLVPGLAGKETLVPAPDDALRYWPVSKRINSVRADKDDKTLIEPIELSAPGAPL